MDKVKIEMKHIFASGFIGYSVSVMPRFWIMVAVPVEVVASVYYFWININATFTNVKYGCVGIGVLAGCASLGDYSECYLIKAFLSVGMGNSIQVAGSTVSKIPLQFIIVVIDNGIEGQAICITVVDGVARRNCLAINGDDSGEVSGF